MIGWKGKFLAAVYILFFAFNYARLQANDSKFRSNRLTREAWTGLEVYNLPTLKII